MATNAIIRSDNAVRSESRFISFILNPTDFNKDILLKLHGFLRSSWGTYLKRTGRECPIWYFSEYSVVRSWVLNKCFWSQKGFCYFTSGHRDHHFVSSYDHCQPIFWSVTIQPVNILVTYSNSINLI